MDLKILIVDDQSPNRLIVRFYLESEGHSCIEAEDGQDAIEKFLKYRPDFVLMDIVMPIMDGYESAYYIKNVAKGRHIPIIFLTAKHDEKSLFRCLECGGDDYLIKPINGTLLKAKIKAHLRTLELTQQIQAKNEELSKVYSNLAREHEMGRHVLTHTLKRNLKGCRNIRQFMSSMSTFNGDIFLLAENPNGGLYVFLGDFTGHGLAAAIGTIPLSQLFYSMCNKGLPISDIIYEINSTLKEFLPDYMFCAATLIHIFERGDCAHVWAGGLPEAYVVRKGKGIVQTIKSNNVPLGILDNESFKNEPSIYRFERGDRLIIVSDGILESVSSMNNEMFGEARLREILQGADENIFERIVKSYQNHIGDQNQSDDISLIEVLAQPYANQSIKGLHIDDESFRDFVPWQLSVNLGVTEVKKPDVLNYIMTLLPSPLRVSYSFEALRTVLSELFANALEHGLLKLSSTIKNTPEGFSQYYRLREQKLNELSTGFIKVKLSTIKQSKRILLTIMVEDSGEGFDYDHDAYNAKDSMQPWGMGISLIKSLSESVTYSPKGNMVEVVVVIN